MNKDVVYLSQPALVSALGEGVAQHMAALLGDKSDYFSRSDAWVTGVPLYFGAVNHPLRAFPAQLPEGLSSRNNQLLWHALAQIEDDIQTVVAEYGVKRIAVVMGTSTTGGDENQAAFEHFLQTQSHQHSGFSQEKQLLSSPADFVAHVYGLQNLRYSLSTACTSGARALISAARLLRLGLCDAVICGGVDTLSTLTINGFHALEVLSAGHCQPFTQGRDGINIGEAAAVFIMTRKADFGLPLLGYGSSSDAHHMSSPRPDAQGAIMAIEKAISQADLTPAQIAWVNLHGTGTVQNDAMEALAIHECLGATVSAASTKGITGHTLGAAGALEAAFLWLVVSEQHNPDGLLPRHRAAHALAQALPNIHLTQKNEAFATRKRVALSTSFAFGGNNTALIIGGSDAKTH